MTRGDDAIAESLDRFARLTQAMMLTRTSGGPLWGDVNITLPQLKVLGLLVGREQPVSGRELAGLLGVGPSAVTPLVDRLVEHGYVRRQEDERDRRITRLLVTEAGVELLRRMMAGRLEIMADLLRHLTTEELAIVNQSFDLLLVAINRACEVTSRPAQMPPATTHEPGAS
jgi:MarR family transcriptional regulator, organic hydroperoxide resistance regulator